MGLVFASGGGAESWPGDGSGGTRCGCSGDRTGRHPRSPERYDRHPRGSCAIFGLIPSGRVMRPDSRPVYTAACARRSRYPRRNRRRCHDRARRLSREDRRAGCAASTRARRTRSRRYSGREEPRGNTSGRGHGRWAREVWICGRPNRPAWPVWCSWLFCKLRVWLSGICRAPGVQRDTREAFRWREWQR